jgi:hypothetical protein
MAHAYACKAYQSSELGHMVIGLKANALTDLLTLMAAGASLNLDSVKQIAKLIRSFI